MVFDTHHAFNFSSSGNYMIWCLHHQAIIDLSSSGNEMIWCLHHQVSIDVLAKEDLLAKGEAICIYSNIIKSGDSSKNMCLLQRSEI